MSQSVVEQALEVLAAGQDFYALRRALFVTAVGRFLAPDSPSDSQADLAHDGAFALNALLSRLPTRALASVASIVKGKTGIKDAIPGPFPLVVTAEARGSADHFDFEGAAVMIPMVSSTGHGDASLKRVHFQDGQYAVGSILSVVQPKDPQQLSARYLHAYLSAFKDELLVSRMVGTANVSLTVSKIGEVPVPLLPITAQRKIDELMALCDRLEARQADAESAHARLVQALLDSLTQASDATDFAASWQRLSEHFHSLFTSESSIDALKQSLLQLAVMGKLVPQDPCDEPASELLKRIDGEKARLTAEGKIKKPKPLADISEDEELFGLPEGWERARFGQLIELVSGQHLGPEEYFNHAKDGAIPYLTGPADFGDFFPEPTRFTHEKRAISVAGDILLTVKGSGVGKTNFVSQHQLAISRQLMAVRPILFDVQFARNVLFSMAEHFQSKSIGIAIPGISREDVLHAVVGIPPLAEQHRIVAKLDQLLALCDQLKTRLTQARQLNEQLASTLVEQAVA